MKNIENTRVTLFAQCGTICLSKNLYTQSHVHIVA